MPRPLEEGDEIPDTEALLCDGDVFVARSLADVIGDRGAVLVLFGFVFGAPALNWWRRYEDLGWDSFDGVPVVGVGRDGPYAQNEFLRRLDSPFRVFADVDGEIADVFGVLRPREGMPDARTARRSVFVVDTGCEVRYSWVARDDITPVPTDEVEEAVGSL